MKMTNHVETVQTAYYKQAQQYKIIKCSHENVGIFYIFNYNHNYTQLHVKYENNNATYYGTSPIK